MNINPINNIQTNFNGYLKFKTGRYVNTKNITTVLYDYPDLVANDKFHSSAFLMSDGLKYIIKYLSKPKATLIENIINADKDHKTIVEIDAQIAAMDRRNAESKYEPIYSQKVAQLRMLML